MFSLSLDCEFIHTSQLLRRTQNESLNIYYLYGVKYYPSQINIAFNRSLKNLLGTVFVTAFILMTNIGSGLQSKTKTKFSEKLTKQIFDWDSLQYDGQASHCRITGAQDV